MSGRLSTAPGLVGAAGAAPAVSFRLGLGEGAGEGVPARSRPVTDTEEPAGRRQPPDRGRRQSALGFSDRVFTLVTTTGLRERGQRVTTTGLRERGQRVTTMGLREQMEAGDNQYIIIAETE